jgi:hypothetical protein
MHRTYGSHGFSQSWIRMISRLMLPRGEARQSLGAPQQEEGLEHRGSVFGPCNKGETKTLGYGI